MPRQPLFEPFNGSCIDALRINALSVPARLCMAWPLPTSALLPHLIPRSPLSRCSSVCLFPNMPSAFCVLLFLLPRLLAPPPPLLLPPLPPLLDLSSKGASPGGPSLTSHTPPLVIVSYHTAYFLYNIFFLYDFC